MSIVIESAARRRFLAAAVLLLAGCASTESLKQARGHGLKRTFRQSYDAVYDAVLTAAAARKLEVVEQDRKAGWVILSSARFSMDAGERIAAFVERNHERSTTVEIVTRAVLPGMVPEDWAAWLYGEMEQALAKSRPGQ